MRKGHTLGNTSPMYPTAKAIAMKHQGGNLDAPVAFVKIGSKDGEFTQGSMKMPPSGAAESDMHRALGWMPAQ